MSPRRSARRIALLTYGSRGDVEPFVALGAGLRRAGCAVRLAAPRPFARFAQSHDLEFVPIDSDPDDLTAALIDRAGLNWPTMIVRMAQHVLPLAAAAFRSASRAAEGADLIVHSFMMTDAGHTLAVRQEVPDVSAQLFPVFLSTSDFPAVAAPDLPLGPMFRRWTHSLNTAAFKYGGRMLYLRVRHGNPHLPRLAPWPFDDSRRVLPVLFGYSREVLPAPSDWPASAVVTGYWFLPTPGGWSPSAELSRFLDSGPPPVYFGVGSMRTRHMHRLVDVAVSAIRAAGLRGILGVPDAAFGDLPRDQFRLVQDVPHDWLFPRMRMLIHHGGAGTTGAALRAGVPSAAVPFTADQAFWGRRIQRLGVGPAPSPALRLTSAGLTRVLDEVTRDAQMQGRAAVLGSRIRQEDGVASAIEVILERLG